MAQETNSPSTVVDDSAVGTLTWASPSNAAANDAAYTTLDGIGTSHYLKATNFGFSIPTGATIDGILVEIEKGRGSECVVKDSAVKLVKGGTVQGDDKADTVTNWTGPSYTEHGSSSDLWGLSLSPSDVNDSGFGVVISAVITSGTFGFDARIDHIQITVYYTENNSNSNFFQLFN